MESSGKINAGKGQKKKEKENKKKKAEHFFEPKVIC